MIAHQIHVEDGCRSRALTFFLRRPTNLADRHPMNSYLLGNVFERLSLLPKLSYLGDSEWRDSDNAGFPGFLDAREHRQQLFP